MESDYTVTLPPLFIKSEPEPLTIQEDVQHADTKNLHSAQSTVRGLRHLQLSWISEKHQQVSEVISTDLKRFFFSPAATLKTL